MNEDFDIDDLATEEIARLLAEDEYALTDDQACAVQNFLWRVGGWENAQRALNLLRHIERAA